MSDKKQIFGHMPTDAVELRKRAEEQARNMEPVIMSAKTPEEILGFLYELRLHQIELEMQKEELRKAHIQVETERARYFDFYDLAPVGYCTLSEEGLILEINLTAAAMLDMTRSTLVMQLLSRYIFNEDQDIYYLYWKCIFESGESHECELRLVKPDRTFFWVHLTGIAAHAEDGVHICRMVLTDITERKQAEEMVLLSNDIVKNAQIGLYIYHLEDINNDWTLMMTYANPAAEKMTGVKACDMVGKTLDENFPYLRAMNIPQRYAEVVRSGISRLFEDIFYSDSRIIQTFFSVKAFPLHNNHVGIAFENVTERKKMEVELFKLKSAVDQSSSTILITNTEGNIEYVNPRFEKTTGYSTSEAIGENPRFLKSGFMKTSTYKELWDTITAGKEWHGEFYNKRKDGSFYWEAVSMSPICNADGKITHFLAVKDDITERKKTEQALTLAKEQAEAASMAKSEFVANMSHEIRTPLNGVIGFTELLKNTPLSPIQQQYVDNANVSGHTLLGIINTILDFSKIEAGALQLEMIKTDMVELLQNSIDIVKYTADKKNLELRLNIDVSMPRFAVTDPIRLKQILTNLLGNAVKFTEKGEVELKIVYENLVEGKGKFIFSIRDTGIGISEEKNEKLFKAFSQADSSTTRKFGGTGLGLVISEMIVHKMGSKIQVDSRRGEGSTFWFEIVTDAEKEDIPAIVVAVDTEIPLPNLRTKTGKILIAEDVELNMILTKAILRKLMPNAELIEAVNGLEALKQFVTFQPDLVFMDVQMPEMDGLEATKMIRKLEVNGGKHIPIISLTSGAFKDEREKCLSAGMDDFLTKPVEIEKIKVVLHKFLMKK